jgi:hypothetical protein
MIKSISKRSVSQFGEDEIKIETQRIVIQIINEPYRLAIDFEIG